MTVVASQVGSSNCNEASPVTNSFTVNPANQTIAAFSPIPILTNGVAYTVTPPAASSGLPVKLSML